MSRARCLLLAIMLTAPTCLAAAADDCPDLPLSRATERATVLRQEIRYHNDLYYKKQQPAISDAQYDGFFAELLKLERCFPALAAADSPTGMVADDSGSQALTLRHERPMLSLNSTIGPEAIEALLHRAALNGVPPRLLLQPKVDGLPVELIYQAGRLISAATRGNGQYGEDVTARVRKITGIPQILSGSYPARVAVRGEIYADLALMAAATAKVSEPYATPRHFAAGTLRSQDPAPLALAALRLFPFELVNADQVAGVSSDLAALAKLADWGFPARLDMTWQVETPEQIRTRYDEYLASRGQHPFAADGIVVKLDDLSQRRRLGEGARAPFWAAAWKFPPATASTLVRSIRWQVGRTGRRTPVAELDPVSLGGVRVSHVTLHNAEALARLGVTAGDQVVIALVADVIPQIQEVVHQGTRAGSSEQASAQPALQPLQPLQLQQSQPGQPGEPALDACLHDAPDCRAQFLARARHFVSKTGLGIPGLGRGRLQQLVEAGLVPDLPSLFRLKPEEVATVVGFGPQSARRLTAALKRVGRPQPFRLVLALGIPGVGPAAAQRLAGQFDSLDSLLITGKGDQRGGTAAEYVRSFFATRGGAELLEGFRQLGLW